MTNYHGFDLVKTEEISELNTQAQLFRHAKTGAELLSLQNDDENKVFGVTFRTPAANSTGIAHIMEHSVLCGSRKYPLKEPFVELIKGSLKTFLNAFTYPDKTCYPVASQNLQDFYNLVDVYLDAVFYPNLTPHILQQEGWHYELENLDDPLVYKGVVFNEMKGAYSSPENMLGRYVQSALFPDNVYFFDSGGDPKNIPDLTYEQFSEFHKTYYHPSNARIFFYGDDDPQERLRLVEEYLADFERIQVDSSIRLQPSLSRPRQITHKYAVTDDDGAAKKGYLMLGWLLPESTDRELALSLGLLSYIIMGTPASPLRKALIESGLGEDAMGGLATHLRQMYFTTGMKGIAMEDAAKVETLIVDTLTALSQGGIDTEMIEAALNSTEFQLRENNTGSFPRGLSLMLRSLGTWLYDADPLVPLAVEERLATIKARIAADPTFFDQLITQHLLQNNHRVTVKLVPDGDKRQEDEALEKDQLSEVQGDMNESDLQAVIDNTHELQRLQETPDSPEALATLPSLKLEDIDKQNKLIPLEVLTDGAHTTLYHDLFTNGIAYVDIGFNMHSLSPELLPYYSLFSKALLTIGTETEDFVKLSQRIDRKTGGVWTSSFISPQRNTDEGSAWFLLRGKSTMGQVDDMLAIMRDVLLTVNLDNQDRIKQMILESKARREAGLVPGGHGVVNTRLRARFNEASWADEQLGGISQLLFIRELAQQIETEWPAILAKLEAVRHALINQNAMFCNVTLDEANWQILQPKLADFTATLPAAPVTQHRWPAQPLPSHEGLTIPAQVNYVGKGANLYDLGYEMDGSISVIANYLRTSWLWEKIRVQGGAYGGFCSFDSESGVFSYLSYRDPNLLKTLDNYDQTANFLRNLDLSDDEVTKSIIGSIGSLDSYQLPDAKGYSSMARYLIGYTDEDRQARRDQILGTTAADFKAFADILDQVNTHGQVVVLGSQEAISEATEARGGHWLEVTKVL
ncbi:MAG: insulinase family protein [Chloroflexota bacterium]